MVSSPQKRIREQGTHTPLSVEKPSAARRSNTPRELHLLSLRRCRGVSQYPHMHMRMGGIHAPALWYPIRIRRDPSQGPPSSGPTSSPLHPRTLSLTTVSREQLRRTLCVSCAPRANRNGVDQTQAASLQHGAHCAERATCRVPIQVRPTSALAVRSQILR